MMQRWGGRLSAAVLSLLALTALGGIPIAVIPRFFSPGLMILPPLIAYIFLAIIRLRQPRPAVFSGSLLRVVWLILVILAATIVILPLFANPLRPFPKTMIGSFYWSHIGILIGALLLETYIQRRRCGPAHEPSPVSCFLVFGAFSLYLLYTANGLLYSSGDNLATKNLPWLVLKQRTIDLSGLQPYRGSDVHYSGFKVGNRILPTFPLGTGFLAIPYSAFALTVSGGRVNALLVDRWEKHFAALLAVATVCLLFFALRKDSGNWPAAGTAFVFGVCTTEFTTGSQGLWSFSGEVFFITLALYFVMPSMKRSWSCILGGIAIGGAVFCRPTAVIILCVLAGILFLTDKRASTSFVISAGLVVGLCACFHQWLYGHPLGAYGLVNSNMWSTHPLPGLVGNLLSPGRGFIVYFPYLLLTPFAYCVTRDDRMQRRWFWGAWVVVLAAYFVASLYEKWWGGHSIGPRLMTEAGPFFALLTLPFWSEWRSKIWLKPIFFLCLAWSALTQFLGVYRPVVYRWNGLINVEEHSEMLWSWRNGQLAAAWIPDWRLETRPYQKPGEEIVGEPGKWYRIDLNSIANARYDRNPFASSGSGDESIAYFPRIDPAIQNTPTALFHFGQRGTLNVLSVGKGIQTQEISLAGQIGTRLHALLAIDQTKRSGQTTVPARWEIQYNDGTKETIPIRLNIDVYDYRPDFRGGLVPDTLVYRGESKDADVLIHSTFMLSHSHIPIISIRLLNLRPASRISICVLAMTIER